MIPLNATPKDLYNAQQRLKYICMYQTIVLIIAQKYIYECFFILGYGLYGDEYTFIIHTLFDYIPEDENNPGEQSYTSYLEKRYKGDICRTIMKLSFIRMYLVGNESNIPNEWTQKLAAAELNINHDHVLKYVDRCSFIINQPVADRFTQNLFPVFGRVWQMQNVVARTLDNVRDDIHFQDILPRIHGCLENREMSINSELHQQSSVNSEDITRFSAEVCTKNLLKYYFEK